METSTNQVCPRCGAGIPAEAPLGLCPRCVLLDAATQTNASPPDPVREPGPTLERVAAAFPQFELVERIGAGGMGVVFKARQPRLDRYVALKLLSEHLARDPQFAERFHREARVLARLNHPNIVTVHDFGESGGFFFLVMEYVDGVNLRDAMRAGRFAPAEALKIIPAVCDALQFAHEEGVLHRDIKPENILLDSRGRVKIADFGIAKLLGNRAEEVTLTASRAALGTPQYMAPEQLEHPEEVDHRADIYSLGVVFYEMLTGEVPMGRFAPPSKKVEIDTRVDDIVLRALARERELRQQSAAEVATEVETVRRTPAGDEAGGGAGEGAGTAGPTTATATRTGSLAGRSPADPLGATGPEPDFLLCHPRLPRMAQLITVYMMVVGPVLGLLTFTSLKLGAFVSPYAQFIDFLCQAFTVLAVLATQGMGIVGGWHLRNLRPAGPRWIRASLWIGLAAGAVLIAGMVWTESLESQWRSRGGLGPQPEDPPLTQGEILVGLVNLVAAVVEIGALVWLTRKRHALARILAAAAPDSVEAAEEAELTAPRDRSLRGATLSAVLTALSLVLGLAFGGAAALYGMGLQQGATWGGLGPVEIGGLLLVLGAVVVPGAWGMGIGLRGLRQARDVRALTGGTGRVVFGVVGWPLVVLELLAALGVAIPLWAVVPGWVAIVLGAVVGILAGEALLRVVWRWLRGVDRGQRAGRLPGWSHGLVGLGLAAGLTAAMPAVSVGLSNFIRSRIPPMVMHLRPDPTSGGETSAERSAVQMGVTFPGRAIIRFRTTLVRDGRPVMSPLTENHVVTGGFEEVDGSVLARVLTPGPTPTVQWELIFTAGPRTLTAAHTGAETAGVRWSPVGLAGPVQFRPGSSHEAPVMHGRGPDGVEWAVILQTSLDPLPPAFLFDEVRMGTGGRWQDTASEGEGALPRPAVSSTP